MSYTSFLSELKDSASRGAVSAPSWLSSEQKTVLQSPYTQSAVLIAGAGAGKTGVLVERVCNLLKAGANPSRLGVFAFTKKSAAEIIRRVQNKLGKHAGMPKCSTLHALAYSLVSKDTPIELAQPYHESYALDQLMPFLPAELEGLSRAELTLALNRAREEFDQTTALGLFGMGYEEYLREQEVWDFTMLLSVAAKKKRKLFDYVIIDEAQDLSQLQLAFLQAIAPTAHTWYVGDPDQAIYAFRGAQPGMMAKLHELVGTIYFLNTNYRSDRAVLQAANNVILHNTRPFQNKWIAASVNTGTVAIQEFANLGLELEFAEQWLLDAADKDERVVLARTQALVAPLKMKGLPAMTVHESKGLEWPKVLVIGCEEGTFPHPMSAPAEERRLFYVAMTRAKHDLILAYSRQRKASTGKERLSSRFLMEAQTCTG